MGLYLIFIGEKMSKKTVLLLTDFSYQAKGRDYFREDIELSNFLRKFFKVCIGHIDDVDKVLDDADLILIRNTGPQITHEGALKILRKRSDLIIFNDLSGKGDIKGKAHLLELFQSGFPVIPTFSSKENLGIYEHYLLKPLNGADSQGIRVLTQADLHLEFFHNMLIQPLIEFQYEVSFYFIGKQFQYALYAPDSQKRWELKPYRASQSDIDFALQFIAWNTCKLGIQRVDACKLQNGELLLMELEDYNPFLSLDCLPNDVKELFLKTLCGSLEELV